MRLHSITAPGAIVLPLLLVAAGAGAQRATLERRKALVERLYKGGPDVIEIN